MADALWVDPAPEIPLDSLQIEWWQEADDLLGLLSHEDSVMGCDHFHCYRLPRTDLALYQLATWYLEQGRAVPAPLLSPIHILAKALVPDGKTLTAGRLSALVQGGNAYYVLMFGTSDLQSHLLVDGVPVEFLQRRDVQQIPEGSRENEHGSLFFDDALVAMTWFIKHYTLHTRGYLLPLMDSDHESERSPEGSAMARSALAEGEKRKQYRAELEADDTMQTLTEEERQERIAFLALPHTFSLEQMQALTEGIARLLGKVQAKPRPWPEQER